MDAQRTMLDALAGAIDAADGLVCVGQATEADEAVDAVDATRPDVVLLDLDLRGGRSLDIVRAVKRYPGTRVVVLAGTVWIDGLVQASDAGADAFLPKDTPLADVLDVVRAAAAGSGGLVVGASTAAALAGRISAMSTGIGERALSRAVELTDREREVLGLLAEACDTKGIARRLGISVHTSRGYLQTLLMKLGAHSQVEAVVVAARMGLIDLSPVAR